MKRSTTFIAISPHNDINEEILDIVKQASRNNPDINWITKGFHLTLVYLGNIPQTSVVSSIDATRKTALVFGKFTIRTGNISYFYKDQRSNDSIIFLDIIDPEKNLKNLHKVLSHNLFEAQFSPGRHFIPHITIGRLKPRRHPHEQKRILSQVSQIDIPLGKEFTVNTLDVYESIGMPTRSPSLRSSVSGRVRYHLLKSFALI